MVDKNRRSRADSQCEAMSEFTRFELPRQGDRGLSGAGRKLAPREATVLGMFPFLATLRLARTQRGLPSPTLPWTTQSEYTPPSPCPMCPSSISLPPKYVDGASTSWQEFIYKADCHLNLLCLRRCTQIYVSITPQLRRYL